MADYLGSQVSVAVTQSQSYNVMAEMFNKIMSNPVTGIRWPEGSMQWRNGVKQIAAITQRNCNDLVVALRNYSDLKYGADQAIAVAANNIKAIVSGL